MPSRATSQYQPMADIFRRRSAASELYPRLMRDSGWDMSCCLCCEVGYGSFECAYDNEGHDR